MLDESCELRLSFLQSVIDALPTPIYYKDAAGRYLGCNRAFEQVHGATIEELRGRTILEIAGGKRAAEIAAEDTELLAQREGLFQILEKNLTYADGSSHEVVLYKTLLQKEDGTVAGLIGTIVDITQRKSVEKALAAQQLFTEALLQNTAVACFVLDAGHNVLLWSKACEELTGIPAHDMLGSNEHWRAFYASPRPCLADLIIDDDVGRAMALYRQIANSLLIPDGLQAEGWYEQVGGKRRYLYFEAAPVRDGDGHIVAAIETLHDLTRLKLAEQALVESERGYRLLVEQSLDAIVVHRGGRIVSANRAAARLFACGNPADLVGREVLTLVHPDDREMVRGRIGDAEANGAEQPYIEERILRLDGVTIIAEVGSIPVHFQGERAVQTILRDVTARRIEQERVWQHAYFDGLTGVPNRMLFHDRLQHCLEMAARERYCVALLYIDLDRFKEVNDTLGHEAGDDLLRQVASRINAILRKTDTIARLGGDEFAVIMPKVLEPPSATMVAGRILTHLERPFALVGGDGFISASIGIAVYPQDGLSIEELMRSADRAMYRVKEGGRSGIANASGGEITRGG